MQASAENEDAAVEWLVRDVRRQSWAATDYGRLLRQRRVVSFGVGNDDMGDVDDDADNVIYQR